MMVSLLLLCGVFCHDLEEDDSVIINNTLANKVTIPQVLIRVEQGARTVQGQLVRPCDWAKQTTAQGPGDGRAGLPAKLQEKGLAELVCGSS